MLYAKAQTQLLQGALRDQQIPLLKAGQPKLAFAKVNQSNIPVLSVDQPKIPLVSVNQPRVPLVDVEQPKIPLVDVNQTPIPLVTVDERKKREAKKLARWDIELIIDITGSMNEIDGTGNLTKFEWCRDQVRNLAERLAPYGDDLTVTIFNTEFETFERCSVTKVDEIYSEIHPHGMTDLVDPLEARLKAIRGKHTRGGRPTLIAVIHDGLPNTPPNPKLINQALISYSQTLTKPDQVIVSFLQIGDTFDGRDFCLDLSDNLVAEGAKYDFVTTKTFADLKKEGMVSALVDALEERISASTGKIKTAYQKRSERFKRSLPQSEAALDAQKKATTNTLKEHEENRHELERALLGGSP